MDGQLTARLAPELNGDVIESLCIGQLGDSQVWNYLGERTAIRGRFGKLVGDGLDQFFERDIRRGGKIKHLREPTHLSQRKVER